MHISTVYQRFAISMVQHTFCQRQRCFCAWTVGGIQFLFVFTAPQMITYIMYIYIYNIYVYIYIYIYLRLYNTWSSRSSPFFADSFVSSRTCPWCKAQFCSGASYWSLNVDNTITKPNTQGFCLAGIDHHKRIISQPGCQVGYRSLTR